MISANDLILVRASAHALGSQGVYWSMLTANAPIDQSHEYEIRGAVLSLMLDDKFLLELVHPTHQLISMLLRSDVISILSRAAFLDQYIEEGMVFTKRQEETIMQKMPAVFKAILKIKSIRDVYLASSDFTSALISAAKRVSRNLILGYSTYEDVKPHLEIIENIVSTLADICPDSALNLFSENNYTLLIDMLCSDRFSTIIPLLHERDLAPLPLIYSLFRYLDRLLQIPCPPSYHVSNICTAMVLFFSKDSDDLSCFHEQMIDIAMHLTRHIAHYSEYKTFIMDLINMVITYFSLSLAAETLSYTDDELKRKDCALKCENSLEVSTELVSADVQGMAYIIKAIMTELHEVYKCQLSNIAQYLSFRQVYYVLLLVARFFCCFGELKEAILLNSLTYSYVPEYDSVHLNTMEVYISSESARAEMNSTAYFGCGGSSEWFSPDNSAKVLKYSSIMHTANSFCCTELLDFMRSISNSSRFINSNMILCPLTRIRNSMLELGTYDKSLYHLCFEKTGLLDRMQYYQTITRPKTAAQRPAEIAYLTCTAHKAIDYSINTSDRSIFRSRREGFNLTSTFLFDDPLPCESIWELTNIQQASPSYLYTLLTCGEISSIISSFLEMYDAYSIFTRRFPDSSMLFELSISSNMEVSDLHNASSIIAPPISVTPHEKMGVSISGSAKKLRAGSNKVNTNIERSKSVDNNEEFLQCCDRRSSNINFSRSNAPQKRASPPQNIGQLIENKDREFLFEGMPTLPVEDTQEHSRPFRFSVSRADSCCHRLSVFSAYSQIPVATNTIPGLSTETERGISRSGSRAIWALSEWNTGTNTLPLNIDIDMDNDVVNLIPGC